MSIAEDTEDRRLRVKVSTRAFELKSLAALIFEAMDSEDFTTRNHYTNAMLEEPPDQAGRQPGGPGRPGKRGTRPNRPVYPFTGDGGALPDTLRAL